MILMTLELLPILVVAGLFGAWIAHLAGMFKR